MPHARLVSCGLLHWFLLGLVACGPQPPGAAPVPSGSALSHGDMSVFQNVFDAIAVRRGNWLGGQPAMACRCEPVVYVNGTRGRGLADLRTIAPAPGMRIMHLSPRDAASRFGDGHEGGAILVDYTRQPS